MADYFSISSFIKDSLPVMSLGRYIDGGGSLTRDISGGGDPQGPWVFPGAWRGEIHDDSLFLSQALYKLRNGAVDRNLGNFNASPAIFAGLPRADIFAYAALFYFPDNFANFYEAFADACRQLDGADCDAATLAKIEAAFNDHGIAPNYYDTGDSYETFNNGTLCRNNNGPECAVDISTMTQLGASIFPLADLDYYSFVAPPGNLSVSIRLPAGSTADTYHAYSLYLFDADRNSLTAAEPVIYSGDPVYPGYCVAAAAPECLTLSQTVSLTYSAPIAGRYYIMVSAGLTTGWSNGGDNSPSLYTLSLDVSRKGSASAAIDSASFDRDEIRFSVPFTVFEMAVHPSSPTMATNDLPPGSELFYQYASLRDHNFAPISLARTNLPTGYLETIAGTILPGTDSRGDPVLNGRVRLKAGFAARYPAIGTVYLEVFGRNHMGRVISMGVSNPLALSADKASLTAYENIISRTNGSAVIRYELLSAGNLTIKIYTVSGALVKTLYSGPVPAGKGTVEWDGKNASGGKTASGIYYIKAEGPGLDKVEKIAVVR